MSVPHHRVRCHFFETIPGIGVITVIVTPPAPYRPFRFLVAVALLASMAMPMVTYACDVTGLIETPMTMASGSSDAEQSDSDCPCEGPMKAICGSRTSECATEVNCYGDSFDADACCASHPEMKQAVASASQGTILVQPILSTGLSELPLREPDAPRIAARDQQRAPPHSTKAPVHILHSSFLL